jgi:hypothetical protein
VREGRRIQEVSKPASSVDLENAYRLANGDILPQIGAGSMQNINLFATIITSRSTGPPNKVSSAPEPAPPMPTDASELVVMATSPPCLIRLSMNLDKPDFKIPPSSSSRIIVTHFPFDVSKDGDITFLKDGVWYQAGRCPECGDVGPAHVHCMRCAPHELKYDLFVNADETVAGPQMEGDPSLEVPAAPYACPIVDDDLPVRVSEECNIIIQKDGMWHPAGECLNCGHFGPGYYPCTHCAPGDFYM